MFLAKAAERPRRVESTWTMHGSPLWHTRIEHRSVMPMALSNSQSSQHRFDACQYPHSPSFRQERGTVGWVSGPEAGDSIIVNGLQMRLGLSHIVAEVHHRAGTAAAKLGDSRPSRPDGRHTAHAKHEKTPGLAGRGLRLMRRDGVSSGITGKRPSRR